MHNFVLRHGRVIEPTLGLDTVADVYISADGCVAGIGTESQPEAVRMGIQIPEEERLEHEWSPIDVTGCIVTPGLIDCHVHAYEHATPLGVNIDRTCLARGVTSVVDAGSAGSSTVKGLLHFVGETSRTRLFCLLHIARQGLADAGCVGVNGSGGECDSLNVVDPDACAATIQSHRDKIVGVKVRLARDVCDGGKNEQEVFRRALEAAERCQVPLMVHHSLSSVPLGGGEGLGCPSSLRPGDIYTHCFHGFRGGLLDPHTGRVSVFAWEAKRRGVLFDVGHGQGSFSWRVATQCASEGFWPDIISSDLHSANVEGPAYGLLAVMAKFLHLGMSLSDVISATTSAPAAAIGKSHQIGQLTLGRKADVTVLRLEETDRKLEDGSGELRPLSHALLPVRVFVGGREFEVGPGIEWGREEVVAECRERYAALLSSQGE